MFDLHVSLFINSFIIILINNLKKTNKIEIHFFYEELIINRLNIFRFQQKYMYFSVWTKHVKVADELPHFSRLYYCILDLITRVYLITFSSIYDNFCGCFGTVHSHFNQFNHMFFFINLRCFEWMNFLQ